MQEQETEELELRGGQMSFLEHLDELRKRKFRNHYSSCVYSLLVRSPRDLRISKRSYPAGPLRGRAA